jgi:hypothetical protein
MAFQIVRIETNQNGEVISRAATEPLFESLEHALAMAEFDASRCRVEYGYDSQADCWWGRDWAGGLARFVIEPVAVDVAA